MPGRDVDSLTLALDALEEALQRRVAAQVKLAMEVEVRSLAGWTPHEIRLEMDLKPAEFSRLRRWLREELAEDHHGQQSPAGEND